MHHILQQLTRLSPLFSPSLSSSKTPNRFLLVITYGVFFLLVAIPLSTAKASPFYGTKNLSLVNSGAEDNHRNKGRDKGTVNGSTYPWSTIGRLNVGGKSYCTGVMIGKKHLYTQASCLYNQTEGRWWDKNELHYRAGYQYDRHLASSNISRIEVSESYNPKSPNSLASIAGNWALITLKKPLGQYTGWLGLKSLDKGMRQQLKTGFSKMFNAGYHNGWEHAIRLSKGCSSEMSKQRIPGVGFIPCRGQKVPQRSLLTFYYQNGSYSLLSSAVFSQKDSPRRSDSWVFASLKNARNKWGNSYRP